MERITEHSTITPYFSSVEVPTQFFHLPANLLNTKAAYLQTGVWAKKAIKEAKFYGEVEVVASSEDKNYSYIPKGYAIPADVDYFHVTSNNTIYGTQLKEDITSPVPLVADMSSDIMSRPVDVSKYALIYGGAVPVRTQEAFVIVRKDILGSGTANCKQWLITARISAKASKTVQCSTHRPFSPFS